MVSFYVLTKEHTGVDPHNGKAIEDQTWSCKESKSDLILMNVTENKIFANESWSDRETR